MEYIRLRDIKLEDKISQRVFICFVLRNKVVREQRDGVTKFVTFDMVDREKVVDAKIFGVDDKMLETISDGCVYNAAVDVKPYAKSKTGYSCIIYNIEKSELSPESFAEWSDDLEGSAKIVQDAIGNTIETYYGKIAYAILLKYWNKFSRWQAASGQHHTQLGGLITHTAEVVHSCEVVADLYNAKYGDNFINKPLLLQAALLHDVCKCDELDVDVQSGQTKYSTYATLQTHIMGILEAVAVEAFNQKIGYQVSKIDSVTGEEIPVKSEDQLEEEIEAVKLLQHVLAAHHGKLEYGSPITPNTPEAYILNMMDELSACMYKYNREFNEIEPGQAQTKWNGTMTSYYKDQTKLDGFDSLD